jgi:phenylpyruvate tautomerase PptA (4-oxalocrotonate tautomerase family)
MIILVKIAENRKTAPKTPLIAQEITDHTLKLKGLITFRVSVQ